MGVDLLEPPTTLIHRRTGAAGVCDGREIFSATDSRYAIDLRPALTLMDMGINSGLALLEVRDVTLAPAEDEVSREIALRLPLAQRNIWNLQIEARRKAAEME